ncbi:MAG: transporter substrate-binding domain-containing protein, partial [Vulcanimicrobiaceae bacterium]
FIHRALVIAFQTVLRVAARAVAQPPRRVCADPNYLPYSDRAGNGFENKVAAAIAKYMGRQLTYTWETMRGDGGFDQFVHNTLRAKKCDLIVDVPYAETDISTTRPYYISSYVFVYKKSKNYDLTSMDSPVLHHLRIGYEVDTPAEDGLKLRALTIGAKPFQISETEGLSPGVFVDAIETNQINVGITWEPAIGYYLKAHPDLAVVTVPNSRSQGSPEQYTFPMAMATRDNDKALHDAVDRAIAAHKPQLEGILHTYGVRFFPVEVSSK